MISLLYGGNLHISKPDVPADHEGYDMGVLKRHHQCFGTLPFSYQEIADDDRLEVLTWVMENTLSGSMGPFRNTTSREIGNEDQEFLLRIMELDPRKRPSAQ